MVGKAATPVDERVAARDEWAPTPEQLAELPAWAVARLLALERANRELSHRVAVAEQLAHHDDISGLPNHRAATALLERTLTAATAAHQARTRDVSPSRRRQERGSRSFAVLFIDGDNLKLYNEDGYEAGNRMIARLAGALAARLRPTDYVARWLSGDEFLAILPGADRTGARRAAERLRAAVEREFRDALIPVTISVGLAVFPEDGTTAGALVDRAVTYNAAAKKAGKNRVLPTAL